MRGLREVRDSLQKFTLIERRDVVFYIIGVMLFKIGTEAFNGSIVALATDRYGGGDGKSSVTFQRIGLLQGLNLGMRCFGSILVGPLIKRYPIRTVLSCACVLFGVSTACVLALDASTGGTFKPSGTIDKTTYYGKFNPDALIPIYAFCGIGNGMVDLIRSIIPRDIVGGHVEKLQQLDALVHIFFMLASIGGSLSTGLYFIPRLGTNRAFIITPICCLLSAFAYSLISDFNLRFVKQPHTHSHDVDKIPLARAIMAGFRDFAEAVVIGARILFSSRNFIWLVTSYGIGSYAHRYNNIGILPQIAQRYFRKPSLSLIMCSGSSIGELLGAITILFCNERFKTPLFFLRIDAILLLLTWVFPFWYPSSTDIRHAFTIMCLMIPMCYA